MNQQTRNLVIYSFAKKVRKDLLHWYEEDFRGNRFFDPFYCGACAVASYWLQQGLKKKHNIYVDIVSNEGHAFCSIGDYVFDPTFSQFVSNKPIYIGAGTTEYHFTEDVLSVTETHERWKEWCNEQNPFSDINQNVFHNWIKTI